MCWISGQLLSYPFALGEAENFQSHQTPLAFCLTVFPSTPLSTPAFSSFQWEGPRWYRTSRHTHQFLRCLLFSSLEPCSLQSLLGRATGFYAASTLFLPSSPSHQVTLFFLAFRLSFLQCRNRNQHLTGSTQIFPCHKIL